MIIIGFKFGDESGKKRSAEQLKEDSKFIMNNLVPLKYLEGKFKMDLTRYVDFLFLKEIYLGSLKYKKEENAYLTIVCNQNSLDINDYRQFWISTEILKRSIKFN